MVTNQTLFTYTLATGQKLQVVRGDLTAETVDVIVNAANERLSHGGGVAGAIVRRGGFLIQQESHDWVRHHGVVATVSAAITSGGSLPARYVIHAVGPIWHNRGDEPSLLRSAVQSALVLCDSYGLHSLALPAISSGIFGFPKPLAVDVIITAVEDYLVSHPDSTIETVRFCSIDAETSDLFLEVARSRAGSA